MPAGSLGGFEKCFVMAFTIARLSRCQRETRRQKGGTHTISGESILITGESNWIQTLLRVKRLSGLSGLSRLSRLFGFSGPNSQTNQMNQTDQSNQPILTRFRVEPS